MLIPDLQMTPLEDGLTRTIAWFRTAMEPTAGPR
jgi:hypothetical protein